MIAIVDYGAGNLRSVRNALVHLGANVVTVNQPEQLKDAEKIVLPGVGAFGAGMKALRDSGFVEPIVKAAKDGGSLIGICLGMQYLFETSNEMGEHQGLGLLKGRVVKFPDSTPLIPHIGWNQLKFEQEHPFLNGVEDGSYAYFVHSYYAPINEYTNAKCFYGIEFTSIVRENNFIGFQFHPEKSGSHGLKLLNDAIKDLL